MWRSIFLHEFIDHRITNFEAYAGAPTPPSLSLTPSVNAPPGTNSVLITPGRGFEYIFATPLQQVIGISLRVRLSYPLTAQAHLFNVIRLGSVAEVLLWPDTHPLPNLQGTRANVRVRIGGTYVNLGAVELPANNFTDLRFDWHTSGQGRVSTDGRLMAYNNSVAPGTSFDVDSVAFGLPHLQPSASHPLYLIARVFVRVLLRSDSLARFSKLLPTFDVPQTDVNRCRLRVMVSLLAMVDKLRQFMTSVNQSLTQTWSQQFGPTDGPFTSQATQAHSLATTAMTELARMMRTGDFSAPDRFLQPFTDFLKIVHAARPTEFKTLATELSAIKVVPDECKAVLEPILEKNKDALAPLITLLSAATERVKRVAGVN